MKATYPPASQTRQPRPNLAGGGTFDHVEKLVLHTTETAGWPGYPDFAPHLTYDPWKHQFNQHFPLTRSATTLVDGDSTSVRENRDFAIQVEIVAYCDPKMAARYGHNINDIDDQAVRDLAALAAWLHQTAGMELRLAPGWLPYPQSYGNTRNRMSGSEYDAFRGILGHEHVSTNVHGDPGNPPWLDRLLSYAKAAAGETTTPATPGIGPKFMDDVYFNFAGKQPLVAGDNEVKINEKGDKTFATGPNKGVDLRAVVDVTDGNGQPIDGVKTFFRVVSYKDGTPATTISSRRATRTDTALYAGTLAADPNPAAGRSARLRLVVNLPDGYIGAAVLQSVQVSGWKL
jgi:hypothetical protein